NESYTGMDDPRWMAKTQQRIDEHLEKCWLEKEQRRLTQTRGDKSPIATPCPHTSGSILPAIETILDRVPGGGGFTRTVITENGEKVTYTFSLATGWA